MRIGTASFVWNGREANALGVTTGQSGGGPPTNEIWRGQIEGGPPEKLFTADSQARYAEPGYLLFLRDGTLRAFKFDKRSNLPMGAPLMVVDGVASILPI